MIKKFIYNKQSELDARAHEELIAMLALKYIKKFDTNLKKDQLDELYEDYPRLPAAAEKEVQEVVAIMVKMAANVPEEFKSKLSKGLFHAIADGIHIAMAEGYSIKSPKKFLGWLLRLDAHAKDKAKKLPEEEADNSYTQWIKYYYMKKNYIKSRQLLADQLAVSAQELMNKGVLLKRRTHKDCFREKDISLHLWVDQGHRDRKDNEIDILDIYLGKTQVDHVRSVRNGGSTTYNNAELMMAPDNLSKGSTSNEGVFPHQETYAFPEDVEDGD